MKRTTTRALQFGLLILVLAAASVTPAAAAGKWPPPVERPYRVNATGTFVAASGEDCDASALPIVICDVEASGTVIGTHIGRGTFTSTGTATLNFAEVCVGRNELPGVPQVVETYTVTVAADGSTLETMQASSSCAVTTAAVGADSIGTFEHVGGSGRLEGATGTGVFLVSAEPDGTLTSSSTGTITY